MRAALWRAAAILCLAWGLASPPPTWADQSIQLHFPRDHHFQFAGYYAALHKGYYAAAGLDVEIIPGEPGKDIIAAVAANERTYGVAGAEILLAYLQGEPVVALGAVMQHSPSAFLSLPEEDIRTPHDFVGKRIMISMESDADLWAVLLSEGVNQNSLIIREPTWDPEVLAAGEVAVMAGSVITKPFYFLSRGIPVKVLSPRQYGVDFYGDCLFTSMSELDNDPERTLTMLEASMRGWEYAMEHPEEMARLILRTYAPELTLEQLLYEAETMRELIRPGLVTPGHMNRGRWDTIAATYRDLGMTDSSRQLDDFVFSPNATAWDRPWVAPLLYGLVGATVLGMIIVVWLYSFNRSLRKAVRGRTAELYRLNQELTLEVADRRKAENAIRESESRYRNLASHFPNGVVMLFDFDLRFLLADGMGLRDMGFSSEMMEGGLVGDLFDDAVCNRLEPSMRAALRGSEEVLHFRYAGEYYESRTLPVFDASGTITAGMMMFQNVTASVRLKEHQQKEQKELKARVDERTRELNASNELLQQEIHDHKQTLEALRREEERLARIIRTTPVGVCIHDPAGMFEYVNPAYCRIFSYMPEDVLHHTYHAVLTPEHTEKLDDMNVRFAAGEPEVSGEYTVRDSKGRVLTVLANAVRIPGDDGRPRMVTFVTDITERKAIELDLMEAKDRAETANTMKSRFLATMSHELRTPLNGIIGMAQLMEPGGDAEEQQEYLGSIQVAAKRLLKVFDEIFEFAKLESGHAQVQQEPLSLASLLEAAVRGQIERAKAKGLELEWEVFEGAPEVVLGDMNLLHMTLGHLVDNAVKFTERGRVRVEAMCAGGCVFRSAEEETVVAQDILFTVRDTGPGITPDERKNIFEAFFQAAEEVLSRKFGGSGLGLAISNRLVALMDGVMAVESEPGVGSVFSFQTPLSVPLELNPPTESGEAEGSGDAPRQDRARLRVLIVDANPLNRAHVQRYCERCGHETTAFDNASDALLALETRRFDVACIDLHLPDGASDALLGALAGASGAAVVAMSFTEGEGKPPPPGVTAVLPKPVPVERLAAVLVGPQGT